MNAYIIEVTGYTPYEYEKCKIHGVFSSHEKAIEEIKKHWHVFQTEFSGYENITVVIYKYKIDNTDEPKTLFERDAKIWGESRPLGEL